MNYENDEKNLLFVCDGNRNEYSGNFSVFTRSSLNSGETPRIFQNLRDSLYFKGDLK